MCLEYGRFFSYVPSLVLVKRGLKLFLDGNDDFWVDATKKTRVGRDFRL